MSAVGLPIGFQIMAPALGEEVLLRVAAEVERASGWNNRRPPLVGADRGV